MTWNRCKDIPYKFLRESLTELFDKKEFSGKYISCYMDREGGIALKISGELPEESIKTVLHAISPDKSSSSPDAQIAIHLRDWDYLGGNTLIFSRPWVDYRRL